MSMEDVVAELRREASWYFKMAEANSSYVPSNSALWEAHGTGLERAADMVERELEQNAERVQT